MALDDVSLKVEPGKIFGLLGPNGAGKTTLLRLISGIIAPDSGNILFNNQLFHPEEYQSVIGYLPEERGLYKGMSVQEHLVYLGGLKGLNKKVAAEMAQVWLEKLSLREWQNNKIEELSKGMQQKVQFIASVIHNPQVVILDEPFTGFDPVNADLLKEEMKNLSRSGKTVIFSTHRMESVEELCDQIALINKGKIVIHGDVAEIRNTYKENKWKITGKGMLNNKHPLYSVIFVRGYDKNFEAIVKPVEGSFSNKLLIALTENAELTGFTEILPPMNEVFLKLVKEEKHE